MNQTYIQFLKFMAEEANKAEDQNVRYALGIKSVSIPLTDDLIRRFAADQKLSIDGNPLTWAVSQGLLSQTGMESGLFECRINFPEKNPPKVGGIIELGRETEAHLSLVLGVIEGQRPADAALIKQVKENVFQNISRDILIEQIIWLEKQGGSSVSSSSPLSDSQRDFAGLSNQELSLRAAQAFNRLSPSVHPAFNSYMASLRDPLVAKGLAQKYREQALTQLGFRSLDLRAYIKKNQILLADRLDKTPSSLSDGLYQLSATGGLFSITASKNVAHNKLLGAEALASMRIVVPEGSVIWRTPSMAATDAYKANQKLPDSRPEKKTDADFIKDTKDKLDTLSNEILKEENGGDRDDFIYYNLITSTGNLYNDNKQTWSTKTIIEGLHDLNMGRLSPEAPPMILLANLSVNQFGAGKPVIRARMSERGLVDEIYDLADLSLLQLLNTKLGSLEGYKEIAIAAGVSLQAYKDFLGARNAYSSPNLNYTNSSFSDSQQEAIDSLRENLAPGVPLPANATSDQFLARVLLKMFLNGSYAKKENGMLVQSLMVAIERNKCVGCKSANERFATVVDQSIVLKDPKFNVNLRAYLAGTINEEDLYSNMAKSYNTDTLYQGPGQSVSLRDQAETAKSERFLAAPAYLVSEGIVEFDESEDEDITEDEGFQILPAKKLRTSSVSKTTHSAISHSGDSNAFIHPAVTNLDQNGTKGLQAHKVQGAVMSSFENIESLAKGFENEMAKLAKETSAHYPSHYDVNKRSGLSRPEPLKVSERRMKKKAAEKIEEVINNIQADRFKLGDQAVQSKIQKYAQELKQYKKTLLYTPGWNSKGDVLGYLDRAIVLCNECVGIASRAPEIEIGQYQTTTFLETQPPLIIDDYQDPDLPNDDNERLVPLQYLLAPFKDDMNERDRALTVVDGMIECLKGYMREKYPQGTRSARATVDKSFLAMMYRQAIKTDSATKDKNIDDLIKQLENLQQRLDKIKPNDPIASQYYDEAMSLSKTKTQSPSIDTPDAKWCLSKAAEDADKKYLDNHQSDSRTLHKNVTDF